MYLHNHSIRRFSSDHRHLRRPILLLRGPSSRRRGMREEAFRKAPWSQNQRVQIACSSLARVSIAGWVHDKRNEKIRKPFYSTIRNSMFPRWNLGTGPFAVSEGYIHKVTEIRVPLPGHIPGRFVIALIAHSRPALSFFSNNAEAATKTAS